MDTAVPVDQMTTVLGVPLLTSAVHLQPLLSLTQAKYHQQVQPCCALLFLQI